MIWPRPGSVRADRAGLPAAAGDDMANAIKYGIVGGIAGLGAPICGTVLQAWLGDGSGGFAARAAEAQGLPLMWLVYTAPVVLAALAFLVGREKDAATGLANGLFGTAQALLSSVSSFSSLNAQTATSVRETTAAVTQLGQTATQAALTAETVVGIAAQAKRTSEEGLLAARTSSDQLLILAGEVRGMAKRIESLNDRMREIFATASVVNYIGDRFKSLADSAVLEIGKIPASKGIPLALRFIVAEMRRQSTDAKGAAAQVKAVLGEAHKAMMGAMVSAQNGVLRAEEGAKVATVSGERIQRLAAALGESSTAAKDIALVAQQQGQGIDEVLKAMNEIFLASQETVTSTQSVAEQAQTLDQLARQLDQKMRS